MFLPQRAYLSIGTLRDQVIYPDGHRDMIRKKGKTEADLQRVLDEARLGYLPSREGGWDTRKEWKDILSGGEKQRMAIARVLYHEPQYAIIDEGTSAVSSDVEGLLYETCKEKGISEFDICHFQGSTLSLNPLANTWRVNEALITISTRASLKKYHTFNLILGMGERGDEWQFDRIGTEHEKMQVEKELQELRERMAQVEKWRERRDEIDRELAKVWVDTGDVLNPPPYVEEDGGSGETAETQAEAQQQSA
jgi:ATP-binding cassette, subfamily D (ALD), peroxisomal long-chain fatty acid import protein